MKVHVPFQSGGCRRAFEHGRREIAALRRRNGRWRAWLPILFTSPSVSAGMGTLFGIVLFAISANALVPELSARLAGMAFWRIHILPASREIGAFLQRLDAGPGVFQHHPAACGAFALPALGAGMVLAWLLRGLWLRARMRRLPAWRCGLRTAVCREAGRCFAMWEGFAGGRGSLRRKTVTGSQFLLLRSGVKMVCDTVRMVVFGWILVASDYGLHALVMMILTILDSFSGLGLDIMIQRDGDDVAERLPVYWTVQMVRGIFLFIIAWFAAPVVARFYAGQLAQTPYSPRFFIYLNRFMGTIFLLRGASGFGREMRQRAMDFRAVILWDIGSALATLLASVLVLFWARNVLALATYVYAAAATRFVVSYLLYPWKPRAAWDAQVARQILLFSSSIVCITLLNSIAGRIDHATVAKVLGMAMLGYYGRAYGLATIPSQSFSNTIAPIMLPALRAVAGDPERFRRAFLKALGVYTAGSFAITLVFGVLAYPLVKYVFGQNGYWLPMLTPLYILLFFGVFRAVGSLTPSALFVLNKPWLVAWCTAVFAGGVAAGVIPMTIHFGLAGTAWTVVLSSFASNALAVFFVLRLVNRQVHAANLAGG